MKYKDAVTLRSKYLKLIGTVDEDGFMYGDIIILPVNVEEQARLIKKYTLNYFRCDWNFNDNDEVVVWAIDINHLMKDNVMVYKVIRE